VNQKKISLLFAVTVLSVAGGVIYWLSCPKDIAAMPDGPKKVVAALDTLRRISSSKELVPFGIPKDQAEAVLYLYKKVDQFGGTIPDDVRASIRAAVPESRSDIEGFLPRFERNCSKQDYQKLVGERGLAWLGSYGIMSALLAGLYEDRRRPEYFERLILYASSSACKDELCAPISKAYQFLLEKVQDNRQTFEDAIGRYEKDLERAFPDAEVDRQVEQLARTYPGCLGGLSASFSESLALDVTRARGLFLLSEYKRLGVMSPQQVDQAQLNLIPGDHIKGEKTDAWGSDFEVDVKNDTMIIRSPGPDTTFDTNDDIVIP
jgi:hypothetical protein